MKVVFNNADHRPRALLGSSTVLALVFITGLGGCARDLARSSSSAIGCPPKTIEVSEVSVGWSQMSWTARCRGVDFYCSGDSSAQCSPAQDPEPMESGAPEPATPAATPRDDNPTAPPSSSKPRREDPNADFTPPSAEPPGPATSTPTAPTPPAEAVPSDSNEDRDEPAND
ncbi:MAG: hypothetical protein AAGF11_21330 [Myxococcota bacterium]